MSKAKLKLVETSLRDQLDEAVATTEERLAAHRLAASEFAKKHSEDPRLIDGDLAGTVLTGGHSDPLHPNAVHEPKSALYRREFEQVQELRRQAHEAEKHVADLQARIEASVTEDERRAALAAAIENVAKSAGLVDAVRLSVNRARSAVTVAEHRLTETSIAEENARRVKAGRVLEAIESDGAIQPDTTLRQTRDAKIEASDDVSFARDALMAVETKLRNAEAAYRSSGEVVLTCSKAVTASAIPRLLGEAQAVQRDLEARRQVLSVLADHDISGAGFGAAANEYLANPIFPFEQAGERPADHPAAKPWLSIIDELACDANAPLPSN